MTTAAQRIWSQRYRRANLAREAARARRWRKLRPGYSTPYVARHRALRKASL